MVAQKDKEIAKWKSLYQNRHKQDSQVLAFKKDEMMRYEHVGMNTRLSVDRKGEKEALKHHLESLPRPSDQEAKHMESMVAQEEDGVDDVCDKGDRLPVL